MTARARKLVWFLISFSIIATAAAVIYFRGNILAPSEAQVPSRPAPIGVACLGRIQPEDGFVTIGARSLSGQPSLVGDLKVKEFDDVKAGQVVAILNSASQLDAALRQAESQIRVAEARLEQAMAPAKDADIAAQRADISRLEVQLANARTDYTRTENLFKEGIVSRALLDQTRLLIDTTPQMIAQSKERLRSLTEVRSIDVEVAKAEVQSAMANLLRARAEAEASIIRAPYDGRIVKINAWNGQEVGPAGILELARVKRMYVIAEVAQNDLPRVKIGQRAEIKGDVLPDPIHGRVEKIGMRVSRNSLTQHDPVGLTDARIMEVRILLDESKSVQNLIDALVEVRILPE